MTAFLPSASFSASACAACADSRRAAALASALVSALARAAAACSSRTDRIFLRRVRIWNNQVPDRARERALAVGDLAGGRDILCESARGRCLFDRARVFGQFVCEVVSGHAAAELLFEPVHRRARRSLRVFQGSTGLLAFVLIAQVAQHARQRFRAAQSSLELGLDTRLGLHGLERGHHPCLLVGRAVQPAGELGRGARGGGRPVRARVGLAHVSRDLLGDLV